MNNKEDEEYQQAVDFAGGVGGYKGPVAKKIDWKKLSIFGILGMAGVAAVLSSQVALLGVIIYLIIKEDND